MRKFLLIMALSLGICSESFGWEMDSEVSNTHDSDAESCPVTGDIGSRPSGSGFICKAEGASTWNLTNCQEYECVGDNGCWLYATCTKCASGYSQSFHKTVYSVVDGSNFTINKCVSIPACTNTCTCGGSQSQSCTITNGGGTQSRTNTGGSCNSCTGANSCSYSSWGTCIPTRCDNGYYKNGNACSKCPAGPGGAAAASKNNGLNGISDCYIAGTFTDASGTFEISGSNCTYKF